MFPPLLTDPFPCQNAKEFLTDRHPELRLPSTARTPSRNSVPFRTPYSSPCLLLPTKKITKKCTLEPHPHDGFSAPLKSPLEQPGSCSLDGTVPPGVQEQGGGTCAGSPPGFLFALPEPKGTNGQTQAPRQKHDELYRDFSPPAKFSSP